jgi:hypothetical protein
LTGVSLAAFIRTAPNLFWHEPQKRSIETNLKPVLVPFSDVSFGFQKQMYSSINFQVLFDRPPQAANNFKKPHGPVCKLLQKMVAGKRKRDNALTANLPPTENAPL